MIDLRKSIQIAMASAAAGGLFVGPVSAQDAVPSARVVDEITVTARKREESIQDIPLSVSALSAETIERAGIQDLSGIANLTAGLIYQDFGGGGLGSPVIRGQAQTDIRSVNANVGVFLDGVFISSRGNLEFQLIDMERVEVVKGPQSALYGNDTFAGAINYVTQRPTEETSGRISGTLGNAGRRDIAGSFSGALIDGLLRGRIAGGYSEFDGTVKNEIGDNLGGWSNKYAVTAQLDFTPNDRFDARLFYYYGQASMDATPGFVYLNNCGGVNRVGGTPTGRGGTEQRFFCGNLFAPDSVRVRDDIVFGNQTITSLGYLSMTLDFDRFIVSSLTSLGNYKSNALVDFYYNAPLNLPPALQQVIIPDFGGSDDWSQELRVSSFGNERIDWTGGLYMNQFKVDRQFAFGFPANPTQITNLLSDTESNQWAVFAGANFHLTDRLTLNTEGRYSSDKRESVLRNVNTGLVREFERRFNDFSYRASLDYTLTDGSLVYVSVAEGTKSGGFNNTPVVSEQVFEAETNLVYELGLKTSLLDGRLTVNTAVFYSKWSDAQILVPSAQVGNPSVAQNVGDVTTYGGEFDLTFAISDSWSLMAGYGYSNPTFDSGTIDIQHTNRCATAADCGLPAGPDGVGIDVSGQRVDRSFRHTAYLSSTYRWFVNQHEIFVRADGSHTGDQPQRSLNLDFIPSRTIWNARIGLVAPGGWDVAIWAQNLFDKKYIYSSVNQPEPPIGSTFTTGHVANGRTFGVSANYRFGGQ